MMRMPVLSRLLAMACVAFAISSYGFVGSAAHASSVPVISIGDQSAVEGDAGTTNMVFTVSLDIPSEFPVSVYFQTENGTAFAPSDYVGGQGWLSFAPSEATKTITVPIVGDTVYEPDEIFAVTLEQPSGALLSTSSATGTIVNDDPLPPPGPEVSIGDASGWAPNPVPQPAWRTVKLPVTISETATSPITVQYRIVPGRYASSNVDFKNGTVRTLVIKPNARTGLTPVTKSIAVHILSAYPTFQPDTQFSVQVVSVSGGSAHVGRGVGVGTIHNLKPAPYVVTIGSVAAVEGDTGIVQMKLAVSLSSPAVSTASVTIGAQNPGLGFKEFKQKVLTFQPGQFQKFVTVSVYADSTAQPDRTLQLTLTNGVGVPILVAGQIGKATILDDD